MTKAKSKKAKTLRPMPRIAYRPSAAPPPPAKKSPWGEFHISPELANHYDPDSDDR